MMEHRTFGPIEWDGVFERWTGRVRLDFFSDYSQLAYFRAEKREPANRRSTPGEDDRAGEFELRLIGPARGAEPSRRQEKAFLHFLDHRDEVCNQVVDAIYDHYRCHWGDWREPADPGAEGPYYHELLIPELSSRDGLKDVISLSCLSVLDDPWDAVAVLGFCFSCTWERLDGLGVLVRDGEVILIGEDDVTWRLPPRGDGWRPKAATNRRLAIQCGIAAVKKLGGKVQRESGEVEVDLLRNDQIEDANLTFLRFFPSLHQLRLASPRITDAGLEVLLEFKDLRHLELSGAAITDSGLKRLHGLRSLKDLYLTGTRITDAGLAELRKLPALSGLHLGGTAVTDIGMKEIGAFRGLKHLDLSGTGVTDAGIRELKGQRALLSLDLHGTRVTDATIAALKEFESLRYLTLSHCNITDLGLQPLKELKSLRSLKIESTATTESGVADLQRAIPGLQVICDKRADSPPQSAPAEYQLASSPAEARLTKPARHPARTERTRAPSSRDWTNTIGMTLVRIEPGEFTMGSPDWNSDAGATEKPQHRVRISKAFYLGACAVTQGQYQAVIGHNPSLFKGLDDRPVEMVSWLEAVAFCNTLSEWEGVEPYYRTEGTDVTIAGRNGYRLPTEAEWEYACRAGTTTLYPFGDDARALGDYAWCIANSEWKPKPVGQKRPNPWGLHDMLGNVWEWCADWYGEKYYASSSRADPPGAPQGSQRVIRGGSYGNAPDDCRPAIRRRCEPECGGSGIGFRVAVVWD
jgi:formylglycine-generating enzyme required for sulfatase activity